MPHWSTHTEAVKENLLLKTKDPLSVPIIMRLTVVPLLGYTCSTTPCIIKGSGASRAEWPIKICLTPKKRARDIFVENSKR